jgi:amino acid adenylation domain-containing protein
MYTKDDLLKRRARLSETQRALLEKQMRGEADAQGAPAFVAIPKRPADAPTPLSFSQERLWFLQQLDPGNAAFNDHRLISINGPLSADLITRVIRELYRRHEVLRSSFRLVDGTPYQIVDQEMHLTYQVPLIDLSHLPQDEREAEARRQTLIEATTPFDLGRGPMLRLFLIRMEPEEHVLLLTMHHIIYDEWSNQMLSDEIKVLYHAFSQGKPSPLRELPIQYGDYAYWQREQLRGDVLQGHLDYWAGKLAAPLPVLELPTDHPRPATPAFRGAAQRIMIAPELTAALQGVSQKEGVTLFMTLLGAFKTLLFYYTNQTDVIVGTYVAGRNIPELEALIGCFINSLPLRSDLSGDPTFADVLKQVRNVTLGAYNHQDVPFEKLIETFQARRDSSRTAIYQAMFVLQNVPKPSEELDLPSAPGRDWEIGEDSLDADAQCDITLMVYELPDGGLRGEFIYDRSLFDAPTMRRMLGHYHTLLEAIVHDSKARLSRLSLLPDQERQQILAEWNATAAPFGQDRAIHWLIEEQAARTPQAVALAHGEERLTYRELNERANRLAHYLRARGVGPEVCVGLCMERSPALIVGLLGILKAGGAYVPLDPTYPMDRLEYIVRDTAMPLALVGRDQARRLPLRPEQIIDLDQDSPAIDRESGADPAPLAQAANLAYIIYTSGSTGAPKGVGVPHGALANFAQSTIAAYAITPADRMLQFASINFDASVEEIFPTLAAGATLVLRNDAMLQSAATFLRTCQEWGVTIADLPTAYWHTLSEPLAAQALDWPPSLRLVIIGGERALPDHWAGWNRALRGRCRLVNTYGPTEATVVATRYEQSAEQGDLAGEVPIGGPISNTQAYILTEAMALAPVGAPGELYIGGADLARGYLGKPAQTAARFVPDPFGGAGARLYKTGDRGRYRADGAIEFLGRTDDQVKIRGFRVELGEIESALSRHPGVKTCAALAREDTPGDRRLVAYVVAAQQPAPTASELHTFLRDRLPEYMIPSALVALPALPLTGSGKLDRRALLAVEVAGPELSAAYEAPGSVIEEELAGIWGEVLKRERIGIYDNFFELGGHSLLITQVIYRVNEAFEIELPLRSLFEEPTIADLAVRVEEALLDKIEQLDEEEVRQLID